MEAYIINQEVLLMKESGYKINFMEQENYIMKIPMNYMSHLTTLTSTLLMNTGCIMKVDMKIVLGEFVNDLKHGNGKMMLNNGEYFVGSFDKDMIEG